MLVHRLATIAEGTDVQAWLEFLEHLQIATRLTLPVPERVLQDRMFGLLRDRVPRLLDGLKDPGDEAYSLVTAILAVASRLNLNTDAPRARLRPLEERFAGDPSYWP
jgi:hypothetical protein